MSAVLTIRLDDNLEMLLNKACDLAGRTKSDLVRDALRRQLALTTFEELRRHTIPHAVGAGFVTDEDIFAAVS
ncbi:MAG: ribbon-helix-helix protein, CopG family [Chthoniobacterales bacterium]